MVRQGAGFILYEIIVKIDDKEPEEINELKISKNAKTWRSRSDDVAVKSKEYHSKYEDWI